MKLSFNLKDITTYRSELMGWSIIWIMMLHFTFIHIKPLGFIAQYGFAGVDIFMFLSGFGLFYSLDKESQLWPFYRKRLLRIFPTYYILGAFASILLFHDSFFGYLFRYSTIGFWTGGLFWEWYIPSIVVLYLFAPLIKKLIDNNLLSILTCLTILVLCISYYIVSHEIVGAKDPHFFFLYRIPAFILGMTSAHWLNKGISIKYYFYILILGIPCFAYLFPQHHEIYNYKYFSLLFLLPFFILCFIIISRILVFLNPIVAQIGRASLEVYLIQTIFFSAIITGQLTINPIWHDAITLALMITSSLFGIFAHWLIDKSGILHLL
jgi:peptidoglycan/LPS O-acetylase OafA/YrhL